VNAEGYPAGEAARAFRLIARQARAWVQTPDIAGLVQLGASARGATIFVPDDRRADWEKLLSGLAAPQIDPARVRARVEGLVRASRLFEREARDRERRARPLAWDDPVDRADGLGPTAREKLSALGVSSVADLVWTLPVGWDDLRAPLGVLEAIDRATASAAALDPPPRLCVRGTVRSASFVSMRGRRAVRVVLVDAAGKGTLDGWWFYPAHGIVGTLRPGTECTFVGRVREREGKRPTMIHPDVVREDERARGIRARYPSTRVPPGILRRAIADAMDRTAPELPDPVPAEIREREGMSDAAPLLRAVHGASSHVAPEQARRALAERLAWVEAFTRVWQRILAERQWGGTQAPALARSERIVAGFVDTLGFALTRSQADAIGRIGQDLASTVPMRRLLLGDVGTGKTVVALAAAAQSVAAGYQCALLVPTTVLAEQHADAAGPLVRTLGARLVRVVAGMRAQERREALAAIASGKADVVVGTHALLGKDVVFAKLGLVVVDEQQRLGVAQRLSLVQKGQGTRPHLLSLSATPIPRTLALALRGELATSTLDERPRGRKPAATELRPRADLAGRLLDETRDACARGERVFVVCPRIDDDEDQESLGAVARAERLASDLAPACVAVVHGGLKVTDRARAMRAFREGEAQVLVGTTVVEVGVDVPEATLMIVDGAEHFGLGQLNQLRGRVGRGERPGRCVLLHDEPLGPLARRRLEALARLTDGTEIAREDLALRGAGDLGGTRQSGVAEDFTWLDIAAAPPLWLERVDADARALLARDPNLEGPEHRALALAVRRFAMEIAVREEAG
jgi:ATP-dependent DNA helicase RecG